MFFVEIRKSEKPTFILRTDKMEKLMELLNEYAYWDNNDLYQRDSDSVELNYLEIISKKFWFIDWLVENEKIDKDKVKLLSVFQETWYYNLYQSLLMILSIQDNSIEFLISVLR